MTRLTPKQRETLEEIRDEDVAVDRYSSKRKDGTTRESWTWCAIGPFDIPFPQTDMSARELKRLRLLEQRGLIDIERIDRWHDGFGWRTVFAVVITDAGEWMLSPPVMR